MTKITLHYQAKEPRHIQIILDGAQIFDETVEPSLKMPPLAFSYEITTPGEHYLGCNDLTHSVGMDSRFSTPDAAAVVIFIQDEMEENNIFVSTEEVYFK
jgi:hypothetical protein